MFKKFVAVLLALCAAGAGGWWVWRHHYQRPRRIAARLRLESRVAENFIIAGSYWKDATMESAVTSSNLYRLWTELRNLEAEKGPPAAATPFAQWKDLLGQLHAALAQDGQSLFAAYPAAQPDAAWDWIFALEADPSAGAIALIKERAAAMSLISEFEQNVLLLSNSSRVLGQARTPGPGLKASYRALLDRQMSLDASAYLIARPDAWTALDGLLAPSPSLRRWWRQQNGRYLDPLYLEWRPASAFQLRSLSRLAPGPSVPPALRKSLEARPAPFKSAAFAPASVLFYGAIQGFSAGDFWEFLLKLAGTQNGPLERLELNFAKATEAPFTSNFLPLIWGEAGALLLDLKYEAPPSAQAGLNRYIFEPRIGFFAASSYPQRIEQYLTMWSKHWEKELPGATGGNLTLTRSDQAQGKARIHKVSFSPMPVLGALELGYAVSGDFILLGVGRDAVADMLRSRPSGETVLKGLHQEGLSNRGDVLVYINHNDLAKHYSGLLNFGRRLLEIETPAPPWMDAAASALYCASLWRSNRPASWNVTLSDLFRNPLLEKVPVEFVLKGPLARESLARFHFQDLLAAEVVIVAGQARRAKELEAALPLKAAKAAKSLPQIEKETRDAYWQLRSGKLSSDQAQTVSQRMKELARRKKELQEAGEKPARRPAQNLAERWASLRTRFREQLEGTRAQKAGESAQPEPAPAAPEREAGEAPLEKSGYSFPIQDKLKKIFKK